MPDPNDSSPDWLWNKAIEAYKARLTLVAAILVAMVSLTGYGLANKMPLVLFTSSLFPGVFLFIDLFITSQFVVPFLYAALVKDVELNPQERVGRIFITFGRCDTNLHEVFDLPPGVPRQRAFLRFYVYRSLWIRIVLAVVGTLGELLLAWYIYMSSC